MAYTFNIIMEITEEKNHSNKVSTEQTLQECIHPTKEQIQEYINPKNTQNFNLCGLYNIVFYIFNNRE